MGCAGREKTAGKGMQSVNRLSGKFILLFAAGQCTHKKGNQGLLIKETFEKLKVDRG